MDNSILTFIFNNLYGDGKFNCLSKKTDFLIIPGREGPKWIIPLKSKHGLIALKQWRPYSFKAYLKWLVILYAYQWNVLKFFPRIEVISFTEKEDGGNFSLQNNIPIIYIGTKNLTQKAVIQLVKNNEMAPYAVLKLPLGEMASQQIIQESTVLNKLPENFNHIAPILLDANLNIQSWMSGTPSSRKLCQQHIDVLLQLKMNATASFSTFVEKLYICLQEFYSETEVPLPILDELYEQLKLLDGNFNCPAVWIHGDFAPWNIKVNSNQLSLIDWEDGHNNGLPLLDLLHFHMIQAYLFNRDVNCLDSFFNNRFVIRYLYRLNITSIMALQLTRYYLISSCVQQLQDEKMDHADYLCQVLISL